MAVTMWIARLIGLALTALFVFAGGNKLTDALDANVHAHLASEFRSYNEIWGFDAYGISADQFRMAIGGLEVLCALLLWTGLAQASAVILLGIMGGAMYTHNAKGEPIVFQAQIFGAILLFIILHSIGSVSSAAPTTTPKKKTKTKKDN